jgi:hypothetical protein
MTPPLDAVPAAPTGAVPAPARIGVGEAATVAAFAGAVGYAASLYNVYVL